MTTAEPPSTIVARVLLLKRFPMFADVSPAALTPLAERVAETTAAAGEAVVREDGEAGTVHFVLEGRLEARRLGFSAGTVGASEVFGDVDALAAAPVSLTTARAAEPTRTLSVSRAGLLAAQEDCFPMQRALLARVAAVGLDVQRRVGWKAVYARCEGAVESLSVPDTPDLAHRVASMRTSREFARLRIRSLGRLAAAARIDSHTRESLLWRTGDPADFAVQVLRGRLRCTVPDGEEFEIAAATLLGLCEALAGQPRWCDVVAASDVVTMRLDVEDILDELEDDADVSAELLSSLALDVAALEDRIVRSGADEREAE